MTLHQAQEQPLPRPLAAPKCGRVGVWLCGGAFAIGLVGCGGGGGSGAAAGGGFGGLSANAIWQQSDASGSAVAALSGTSSSGGFGAELPAAVNTVRLDFAPDAGEACCVAIDPRQIPADPASGRRRVVLSRIPVGPGRLTIAGFPGSTATAPSGASSLCALEPASAAAPCVSGQLDGPSFVSEPTRVEVRGGTEVNAGDILVPAVPFFLVGTLQPRPASTVTSPVQIAATVAISGTELPLDRISISTSPGGAADLNLVTCDDFSSNPCSPGGALQVRGLRGLGSTAAVPSGAATIAIVASGDGPPLSLSYGFTVARVEVSPSPSATAIATATRSAAATATASAPRATATPRSSTPTVPSFTSTPTHTARPTETVGSPTATPNAMCGPVPAQGCRQSIEGSRSMLIIGQSANPNNDRMIFEWDRGSFTERRDFGDPGLTTSYAVCIYDGVGTAPTLLRQLFLPAGPDCPAAGCWSITDDGFRYRDAGRLRDGIEQVDLTAGLPGRANIRVRAGGRNLALPALPLAQNPTVVVQVKNDFEEGQCWEARFSRPADRNDDGLFRDAGDNPISFGP